MIACVCVCARTPWSAPSPSYTSTLSNKRFGSHYRHAFRILITLQTTQLFLVRLDCLAWNSYNEERTRAEKSGLLSHRLANFVLEFSRLWKNAWKFANILESDLQSTWIIVDFNRIMCHINRLNVEPPKFTQGNGVPGKYAAIYLFFLIVYVFRSKFSKAFIHKYIYIYTHTAHTYSHVSYCRCERAH